MRYGPDDKFWVVTDPAPESELGDVLFEASLRDLDLQFKGGLKMESNPTLFTEKGEAETEARARLIARNVTQTIQRATRGISLLHARLVRLIDKDGELLFEGEVRE
ncbi:MAG: hypothetical protein HYY16_12180 [Planctomycetes bacterium]|nr:hypothetical protein [Planctomycetota bacterium]